ncbi:hypothetical protein [Sulfitobacter sp. W074]|uniref:hypothetical protein n=1 Tax=Sulfitobacter sp. W074 TaxID=2867026 RepID=UPI0021A5180C|nr:hypothetical protein [Sulfitobacter sp. W074]UWR38382.1 hypothetical protein K3762_04945 [Sulfitobacter sp. W074]
MNIDMRRLDRRLNPLAREYPEAAKDAVNATAFSLRKKTPDYLQRKLDEPIKFTTGAGVAKVDKARAATSRGVTANIKIQRIQASYLSKLEHGEKTRRVNAPSAAKARDRAGNTKKAFALCQDKIAKLLGQRIRAGKKGKTVGKYFIGRALGRGRAPAGIFERHGKNKKLRRITLIIYERRNEPQLKLRDYWRHQGSTTLREKFNEKLAEAARETR